MKQKLIIGVFLILLIALLVGLNAASYVQKQTAPDSEADPNRSSYNVGSTGSQAFYSLLSETGYKVARWQQPPTGLTAYDMDSPSVFVVIGGLRREFTAVETAELLEWVSNGGRLVLIDREPPEGLAVTTSNWQITFGDAFDPELFNVDPSDRNIMISGAAAIKPVQPTLFTQNVIAVQPSRFAVSIGFTPYTNENTEQHSPPPPPPAAEDHEEDYEDPDDSPREFYRVPSPTPVRPLPMDTDEDPSLTSTDQVPSPAMTAPLVHVADGNINLVVDAPFGEGRIVLLSDPFIVSNEGISLVDNAQLAINLVSVRDGVIAFDEFHQGYGADDNRFLQFFEGTPVIAIFIQALILVGFIFYSRSRRFARPVPEPEPDRLSKLEYVSAMAELQKRTKAYDLAIENIYNDFRRRTTRYFGLDNFSATCSDIAGRIAERTGLDAAQITETMFKCEEIIRGEPTTKREALQLTEALRSIEQKLGLTRAARKRI